MRKILRRQKRAQGMTEYIIIVGLIAIVLIAAVKAFSGQVNAGFDSAKGQIEKEVVVDREAIDKEPFIADGGFTRLNKVFGGELETIHAGINEEMWKKTA